METYWGCGDVAPCIHIFGTRCRWVVGFTNRSLYSRRRAPDTHWIWGLDGHQSRSGCGADIRMKFAELLAVLVDLSNKLLFNIF